MLSYRWLFLCASVLAHAQDPFEIQVFEYDPLPRGAFTYEAHINDDVSASASARTGTAATGAAVALQGQFHFSSELTAGITDWFRAGAVELTAAVPGYGIEYAGFRVLEYCFNFFAYPFCSKFG